jgi:hypothetical protein
MIHLWLLSVGGQWRQSEPTAALDALAGRRAACIALPTDTRRRLRAVINLDCADVRIGNVTHSV